MSGFSADWLRLREPFDTAARETSLLAPPGSGWQNPAGAEVAASDRTSLREALAGWRRSRAEVTVLDLGAGTGANLRFLAPRLGGPQRWLLVDDDPDLLGRVAGETRAWARAAGLEVTADGKGLRVLGSDLDCRLALHRADLAVALDDLPFGGCDLVAASALLDLVSTAWLGRLVARARENRCALLAALTYDGRIRWEPPEAGDEQVRLLVNRHQRTDKGFGPALGPEASGTAPTLFEASGYQVVTAASDWRIGPGDRPIQHALLDGWVSAARAIEPGAQTWLAGWQARRQRCIDEGHSTLAVGHLDVFGRT